MHVHGKSWHQCLVSLSTHICWIRWIFAHIHWIFNWLGAGRSNGFNKRKNGVSNSCVKKLKVRSVFVPVTQTAENICYYIPYILFTYWCKGIHTLIIPWYHHSKGSWLRDKYGYLKLELGSKIRIRIQKATIQIRISIQKQRFKHVKHNESNPSISWHYKS